MHMPLNLKRNLKLLGGFIGNGEPPPPPPCVRACFSNGRKGMRMMTLQQERKF